MIKQINDFINKYLKEGQLRLLPWLLRTSSLIFIILLATIIVIDLTEESRLWVKYSVFILFVYFFVKKDIENFWHIRYLRRMYNEIKSMNKITEALRSTMKLDQLLDMILKSLTMELRYERAFIFLLVQKGEKEYLKGETGVGIFNEILRSQEFEMDESAGLIPKTAMEKKPFIVKDARNDYRCEQKLVELLNLNEFATIPLIARDSVLGVLVVVADGYSKASISDEDISLLDLFANQSAIAIQNARFYETIEKFSVTDGLTGLFNHRYFQDSLRKEFEMTGESKADISLIYLDLDNFKHYNDTFGHLYGDQVLRDTGSILRKIIGDSGVSARYGGEEFAVILPGASKKNAAEIAEKIRVAIQDYRFVNETDAPENAITVSVGVSNYPADAKNNRELIDSADRRLYIAKKNGKNRVVSE